MTDIIESYYCNYCHDEVMDIDEGLKFLFINLDPFNYPTNLHLNQSVYYFDHFYDASSMYIDDLYLNPLVDCSGDFFEISPTKLVNSFKTFTNMTTQHNTIFTNFREEFIYNYHQKVKDQKLFAVSQESNDVYIDEKSFNYLKDLATHGYDYGLLSEKKKGFEGFISDHTYFRVTKNSTSGYYNLNCLFSLNPEIKDVLSNLNIIKKPSSISWITGISNDGELIVEQLPIQPLTEIYDSFYPWLGDYNLDTYLDNYLKSNESILLLYGEKGTGKSNLLKHLLYKSGESALITYQDDIRDLDIMFSRFITGPEKFLIIEDADEFLIKREHGNKSMKRLLNIADGLTSNKDKKVIFTTNLSSLNNVDDALTRDGRCFDCVYFNKYTKEQSIAVSSDLNINTELLIKPSYTLAELFALKNNKLKRNQTSEKITFGLRP